MKSLATTVDPAAAGAKPLTFASLHQRDRHSSSGKMTFCGLFERPKKTVPCAEVRCAGECGVPVANIFAALTSAESENVALDDAADDDVIASALGCLNVERT